MNNIEIIKENIHYLLMSRKETHVSLSEGAGVNRTTIYNILEGKVVRVQDNTLRKVAGFLVFPSVKYKLQIYEKKNFQIVLFLWKET